MESASDEIVNKEHEIPETPYNEIIAVLAENETVDKIPEVKIEK